MPATRSGQSSLRPSGAQPKRDTPLVIVDGHNLLWRASYGFPARIKTRSGVDRTGVFGFFALLRAGLRGVGPAPECIVCFDGEFGAGDRQAVDPTYKENRQSVDMTPIESLPDVLAGLDLISVRWFYRDDLEADDVVATVVANEADRRTFIMSTDRDFYQLVGESVLILNTRLRSDRRIVGPQEIIDRYGVEPAQWCDYRALTGDASDNIRGVRGVGPITAKRLLWGGIRLEDIAPLGRLTGKIGQKIRDRETWNQLMKDRLLILLCCVMSHPVRREGKSLDDLEKEFVQHHVSESGDAFSSLRGGNPARGQAKGLFETAGAVDALG